MTDDAEKLSDSQDSVASMLCAAMDEHVANGGTVVVSSVHTLEEKLWQSDSDEDCARSSISKTEVVAENFSSNMCESSPVDSGYQPLSNDTVSIGEDIAISPNVTPVSALLQREKIRGHYDFSISIAERHEATKNMPYTFSHALGKLYIKMDAHCPVTFLCEPPPMGAVIRAMILFSADEHAPKPVTRCVIHKQKDRSKLDGHVLRVADHYVGHYDQLGQHFCVLTPYKVPDVDASPFVINYKFGCLSSCIGGMNRRSTCLVFTLEDSNGVVLGRDYVSLKVCSSPGRDKPKEEGKKHKLDTNASSEQPASKYRALLPESSGYRCVLVREEHYECLRKIANALNLSSVVTPEQRRKYLEEEL